MPDQQPSQRSLYYQQRPILMPGGGPQRRSRLEGNRLLLAIAIGVLLVAAVAGVVYFQKGLQTQVTGPTPFQQQQAPLLP